VTDEEKQRVISSARSHCWEAYGEKTITFTDAQCLIRAAVLVGRMSEEAQVFLDLAEEMSG